MEFRAGNSERKANGTSIESSDRLAIIIMEKDQKEKIVAVRIQMVLINATACNVVMANKTLVTVHSSAPRKML